MATRDVAAYLAELKLRTGRSNSSFDTLIYEFINDLMEKVETDPEKLWFLDKTVRFTLGVADVGANGLVVKMPNDLEQAYDPMFLVDLALNTFTPVKSMAPDAARKRYGPQDTGQPDRFSEEGESFRIWPPIPDATYTFELSYKAKLIRVSASEDTNAFLQNYHAIIMDGLRAQAWEYLGQEERAAGYWSKWERGWADLRASNVARVLGGEQQFAPRTDVNGSSDSERGGAKLTWGWEG